MTSAVNLLGLSSFFTVRSCSGDLLHRHTAVNDLEAGLTEVKDFFNDYTVAIFFCARDDAIVEWGSIRVRVMRDR